MSKPKEIALIYDFDGTLAEGNLPDHKLLPDIGIDKESFWQEVEKITEEKDIDGVLAYMYLLAKYAKEKNFKLSRKILNGYGQDVPLFSGVQDWFERINSYSAKISNNDYILKHYVISSGLYEIMEATSIAKHFQTIFASKYIFDDQDNLLCPGVAINYTTKTQYLFRINKGILNHHDNKGLNKWMVMKKRPVSFERMIYLGDGDTDIPAMKMVKFHGGSSLGVFGPKEWADTKHKEKIYKLISEDRVNYVAPADYSANSQLDVIIKGLLERIISEEK